MSVVRVKLFLFLAASALHAGSPLLRDMEPHGAQRGKAVSLTLTGSDLAEGAAVLSSLPATFTSLVPKEGRMYEGSLAYLVEVKADAAVGLYPIRVRTDDGLSNILLFSVGPFPEIAEEETQEYSNDSPDKATLISAPVIVNGALRGPDQDFYRFRAKAGERLVFEVEARRAGSAIDPLIRVFDSSRKEIAANDDAPGLGVDARVDVTFPADGEYHVAVHDSKFSAQAQNFYRLKIGSFAYADGLFPLGGPRGSQVDVELFGGNLPAPVKVRADLTSLDRAAPFTMLSVPGAPGSLPFPFAVSDLPEIAEPAETLPPATILNGRIAQPNEVDRYKLAVAPGEQWLVELEKATLGTSRLYGVLAIYDNKGKRLASAGDSPPDPESSFLVSAGEGNADPYLAFKAPPDTHEVVVTIEDLLHRGGPGFGYRLLARKQPPDFNLTVATPFVNVPLGGTAAVAVSAERRGLVRPIHLSVPNPPDDLIIEGGNIPGESGGQTRVRTSRTGVLTIRPKPGAKPRTLRLEIWGESTLDSGEVIRRRAQGPGLVTAVRGTNQRAFTAPWLGLELPATVARERPTALEVLSPRYVRLVQGMETDVEWKLVRRAMGIRPPGRVNAGNLPGVGNLRVLGEKTKGNSETGKLTLVTTVGTPPMKFDMVLDTQVNIDGRDETIVAPAITFDIVQGYTIEAPAGAVSVQPGGKFELAARLQWEEAFSAPVTIKADNLPPNLTCQAAEAKAKAPEARLSCEAGPAAPPGEYEIGLVSSSTLAGRDKENVPYTIPAVPVKLKVTK